MKPPTKFEIMRANRRPVENFQHRLMVLESDREMLIKLSRNLPNVGINIGPDSDTLSAEKKLVMVEMQCLIDRMIKP